VARDWCVHDLQYVLSWALVELEGFEVLARQVEWLAGLLARRDYPLERLARSLELTRDVLRERLPAHADAIDDAFAGAARALDTAG
jgi:hypothetical protein